jgi:hypothetical protein
MPAARLDITQFPYSVTQPWQGNDATAPDYTAAVQQAIDDLAANGWGLLDTMGTDGGAIDFPPWVVSISDKLIMRDGVRFVGNNKAASRLLMRESFPGTVPGKHMIDLGDATSGHASFGGGIQDMHISARKGVLSVAGNFVVYSNNVQDSGAIIDNCIIDGGSHFGGIKYMEGVGGASLVKFADIQVNCRKDAILLGNVTMVVKVSGATMVEIDGFEPACDWIDDDHPELGAVANSYGLLALGGTFKIRRVHGEKVKWPVYFGEYAGGGPQWPGGPNSPATDDNNQAYVEMVTGGGGNTKIIWMDSAKWKGRLTLDHIMPKSGSIPHTLYSTVSGVSSITTEIIDRIRV